MKLLSRSPDSAISSDTSLPENLIIRYFESMRTITATEASRNFKALLDAVEGGESVAITRGGETIAEMTPVKRKTAQDFFDAIEKLPRSTEEEYQEMKALVEELRKPDPEHWEALWSRF